MRRRDRGSAPATQRSLRLRNVCLRTLAWRRGMPVPTAEELAAVDDRASLTDAVAWWEARHASARPLDEPNVSGSATRRGRRRVVVLRLLGAVLLAGFGLAVTPVKVL